RGLIVHGGHAGEDLNVGYDNWRKALDAVDMHVPILIETTASGDGAVARGADRIADLWPPVLAGKAGARVDLSLDPCPARTSGEGEIPEADLRAAIREAQAPVILETPGGAEEHKADLAWLRS